MFLLWSEVGKLFGPICDIWSAIAMTRVDFQIKSKFHSVGRQEPPVQVVKSLVHFPEARGAVTAAACQRRR